MSKVWAVIVSVVVVMILYGIVSSKLTAMRQRRAREKLLPYLSETIRTGQRYNVYLSDGRSFPDVELLGTNDPGSGQSPLGGWEGMLVLSRSTGKRVFVKQASVRCVEEA
jgi:hypothetical protein